MTVAPHPAHTNAIVSDIVLSFGPAPDLFNVLVNEEFRRRVARPSMALRRWRKYLRGPPNKSRGQNYPRPFGTHCYRAITCWHR
jgi:hypothetical protein